MLMLDPDMLPCLPQFAMADGIGVSVFGEQAIVLDIHRNRYSLLQGAAAQVLKSVQAGHSVNSEDPVACALAARHILTLEATSPGPWFDPAELPQADASVLEGGEENAIPQIADLRVVVGCLKSRIDLRLISLARILRALPRKWRGRSMADLVAAARRFDRGRRLTPSAPRCLPDALAFVRLARAQGHAVYLVFGVKLHPFEAHCWAQSGSLVLTDPLERVRRFTPILAV